MIAITDRKLPIARLVPNPRNPNRHPAEQIDRLVASLRRDGQTKPLLARKANSMLIAGHGVRMAAQQLGWTELQVRLLDCDQATADRIMLADNRFSELSSRDRDRVADLLREIEAEDWLTAGYSDDDVTKYLTDAEGRKITVQEVDTSTVVDTFWIAVRGPLAEQADVLEKLKALLKEYPHVEVEMATVNNETY